jgi:hypothetical protein
MVFTCYGCSLMQQISQFAGLLQLLRILVAGPLQLLHDKLFFLSITSLDRLAVAYSLVLDTSSKMILTVNSVYPGR